MDKIETLSSLGSAIVSTKLAIKENERISKILKDRIKRIDKILNGTPSNSPSSPLAL
jgi:hypothetical protein